MSIMILAAFLLIIFTVMAFLKNVYAQKQKTAKEIISNSIKGVLYFVFVPVCTLLGVYLGNIVLKAVDGATSLGGATSMGGKLFVASAYDANKFRTGELGKDDFGKLKQTAESFGFKYSENIKENLTTAEYADLLDQVFATSPGAEYTIDKVGDFYNTMDFNYMMLIVGGVFILYVLCSLAFAMARRIFIMLIWFTISPACCAMFPLDEGKMVGKYKDEMTKQVLSAYGAVAGMNLFMSVSPLIDNIQITDLPPGGSGFVNLFIIICGLLCVKELVSSLSSLVGGEDALAKGSSLMKSSTGAIKKHAGGIAKKGAGMVGTFAGNVKSFGWGKGIGASLGDGAKGIGNFLTKNTLGVDVKDTIKTFKDTSKSTKSDNRESMMKKERSKYLKTSTGHRDEKKTTAFGKNVDKIKELRGDNFKKKTNESDQEATERQQYEIGEQVNKTIKGGAPHFASQDEVLEELSKKTGMSEAELREAHAAYESKHAKSESVNALHGAGLAAAEAGYTAAKTKNDNAVNEEEKAKDNAEKGEKDVEEQAATVSEKAKELNIGTANVVIDKANTAVQNNNFSGAIDLLKGINLEGVSVEFADAVRSLITSVEGLRDAEERAKQATANREETERELASKASELQRKIDEVNAAFGNAAKGMVKNVEENLAAVKGMLNR